MNVLADQVVDNNILLHEVAVLRQQGYRLVTLTCLHTGPGAGHEVIYHFDRGYALRHLRLRLAEGESLFSISSIYPAAMIVENEIKDHFGVRFEGLSVDFQGRLLLSEGAPKAPMNKRCGMEIDARRPSSTVEVPAIPRAGGAA